MFYVYFAAIRIYYEIRALTTMFTCDLWRFDAMRFSSRSQYYNFGRPSIDVSYCIINYNRFPSCYTIYQYKKKNWKTRFFIFVKISSRVWNARFGARKVMGFQILCRQRYYFSSLGKPLMQAELSKLRNCSIDFGQLPIIFDTPTDMRMGYSVPAVRRTGT